MPLKLINQSLNQQDASDFLSPLDRYFNSTSLTLYQNMKTYVILNVVILIMMWSQKETIQYIGISKWMKYIYIWKFLLK